MCTISWFYHENGYDVFFNRDEQVSRPRAEPPAIVDSGDIPGIMPVDPQGGGTWVAVNQYGFTFALLNYYQGRLPKGKLRSRGRIIPALLAASSVDRAAHILKQVELDRYAPFSLLFFSRLDRSANTRKALVKVPLYRWTGKALEEGVQDSPLISSAVNYQAVLAQRLALYESEIPRVNAPTQADFYRLHRSHLPEKSAYSICMHRADARTVSLSHIAVDTKRISFNYFDGSPCESREGSVVEMDILPVSS